MGKLNPRKRTKQIDARAVSGLQMCTPEIFEKSGANSTGHRLTGSITKVLHEGSQAPALSRRAVQSKN